MNVDVIIVLKQGIVDSQYVITNEITAEAQFDTLVEELTGDTREELDLGIDYGESFTELNRLLKPVGVEVIWLTQVEVNEYTNDK
tara:strand:+ start:2946 stop:3200 length:255 start_codon:yes stop_codon:yes gene_type:complete